MSMLQDTFELAVVISAVDKFTAPMKKMMDTMKYNQQNLDMITKSMKSFGSSSAEIDKVTNSLNKLERNNAWAKMAQDLQKTGMAQTDIDQLAQHFDKVTAAQDAASKSFQKFQGVTVAGAAITGAGLLMADALGKAAEKAGELQLAVKSVGTAMKLDPAQMQQLSNMSMTLGIPTMFDSVTTSKIIGAMYTAGLSKQQVLDPNIARQYVNFADVQAATKHEDPTAAVSDAATMAHAYQLYSTSQITPFLNNLNAMLMQSHQTLSQFKTQYSYVASQALRSGMSSNDALTATAWLNRMSIGGGKGGTNFADFLQRSYFGSSGQKADDAMVAAGLVTGATLVPAQKVNGRTVAAHYQGGKSVFFDDQGNFIGMDKAGQIMQQLSQRYGGNMNQLNPIIQAIWGTQGGRVASALMSSGSLDQWHNIQKATASTASVNTMQAQTNDTLPMQWKQFKSTMTDIAQAFGQQLIPALQGTLKWLNMIAGKILEFELAHPKLTQFIADFGLILAAVALVVGPIMTFVGAMGMAVAGIKLLTGAETAWEAVQWALNAAMDANPIGLIILAIAALTAGVIWCYQNWDIVKQKMQQTWTVMQNNPLMMLAAPGVGQMFLLVDALVQVATHWDDLKTSFMQGWYDIENTTIDGINRIIDAYNKFVGFVNHVPGVHLSGVADIENVGTYAPPSSAPAYSPVQINIHPAPSHNSYDIANAVSNTLNRNTTTQARNNGYQVNLAGMGG